MSKVTTYANSHYKWIEKLQAIKDDIYWATINCPMTVTAIACAPFDLAEAILTDTGKLVVIDEKVID